MTYWNECCNSTPFQSSVNNFFCSCMYNKYNCLEIKMEKLLTSVKQMCITIFFFWAKNVFHRNNMTFPHPHTDDGFMLKNTFTFEVIKQNKKQNVIVPCFSFGKCYFTSNNKITATCSFFSKLIRRIFLKYSHIAPLYVYTLYVIPHYIELQDWVYNTTTCSDCLK